MVKSVIWNIARRLSVVLLIFNKASHKAKFNKIYKTVTLDKEIYW